MFKQRSLHKELLDAEDIPQKDLEQNLRELHQINKYLGGYRISRKALHGILREKEHTVLLDIGCGGGDSLKELHTWSLRKNYSLQLNGIDIKPGCIDYSAQNTAGKPGIRLICDDYRNISAHLPAIDVLHASLFCHHLQDEEIIDLIRFARDNRMTLVINDLERNPLAYYGIKALTAFLSGSYLVKNDAPLSVLRGFTKNDWERLLKQSGATRYSIKKRWAFRHEVIVYYE